MDVTIMDNDGSIKGKPLSRELQYKSPIERICPFVSKPSEWYIDPANRNICTHCKENDIVKTELMLVPFCQRCYDLMHLRHDGTYIVHHTYAIAKDLVDIQTGKVKMKPYNTKVDYKVIQE